MVKVENLEQKNMVKLIITVDAAEFEKAVEKAYQKKKSKLSVPGFRNGKVPRNVVEKMYGKGVFYEDAANIVIPDAYEKAVNESGLDIVSQPGIDVVTLEEGKDFVFSAEVAVKPEAVLGKYKGVAIDKVDVNVTDEDIDAELKKVQEQNGRLVSVEDRAVKDGDIAVIDFEGFKDGVAFEGGKGENHELVIGSGSFIPGFEDQIIGHSIGEEFDVNVTFPEKYQEASLAGKPAVFKVKVNGIKVKELPAIDDDFAQDVSEFDTLSEYKEDIKKNLLEQKEKAAKAAKETAVIDAIAAEAQMDIPEPMIDSNVQQMAEEFAQRVSSQGLPIDQYFKLTGLTREKFLEELRPQAEKRIKTRLVLDAIVKAENITASDDEYEEEVKRMAEQYQMDVAKLHELISDKEKKFILEDICATKALDLARDNAVEK